MTQIRAKLQHRLNPLHIYCRLRNLGLAHRTARVVSTCYEKIVYRLVLA